MGISRTRPWAAALLFGLAGAPSLSGQVDYRNLDDGRPTRVTDAYPVERFAFEFSAGVGSGAAKGLPRPIWSTGFSGT